MIMLDVTDRPPVGKETSEGLDTLEMEPGPAFTRSPAGKSSAGLEGGLPAHLSPIVLSVCEVKVRLHLYLHLWHHEDRTP